MKHSFYRIALLLLAWGIVCCPKALGQDNAALPAVDLNYVTPGNYLIEDIQVTGLHTLKKEAMLAFVGIRPGDTIKIPGPAIQDTLQKIWKQKLVKDVALYATVVAEQRVVLTLHLTESPRLADYTFAGLKKREAKKLHEKISLVKGKMVTDEQLQQTQKTLQDYWIEEGYLHAVVTITTLPDPTLPNQVRLKIHIDKGERTIINQVLFEGNQQLSSQELSSQMQHIREKPRFTLVKDLLRQVGTLAPLRKGGWLWRAPDLTATSQYLREHVILFSSKLHPVKLAEDKKRLLAYYQSQGFRDAALLEHTVYQPEKGHLNVVLKIQEGKQYRVGNIRWVGNTRHDDALLNEIVDFKPGDIYNVPLLQQRLHGNPEGPDVASLYKDNGYLFFHADPVEVGLDGDRVDLEIRIYEGRQAHIREILIEGNSMTHDYVIQRELRTLPGEKFSVTQMRRSYRELALLNIFDPAIDITPLPHPAKGAVDLKYKVKERPKVEVKASVSFAHWRPIGGLILNINNFSLRNIFRRRLPVGEGQNFILKAEGDSQTYRNFMFQFTEPWLGGKKPRELYLGASVSLGDNRSATGGRVGLGTRLTNWDDYLTLKYGLAYYYRSYKDYDFLDDGNTYAQGSLRELSTNVSVERNSTDSAIYPKEGAKLGLHMTLTPPWSLWTRQDYSQRVGPARYPWKEYHQWMLDGAWFQQLVGDLVFHVRGHAGFLGGFNAQQAIGPFERFYLGGGMGMVDNALTLRGKEQISLRGYDDASIVPRDKATGYRGGVIYNKVALELRYPIVFSYAASVYALGFAEAGNTWARYEDYDLGALKKAAGVGIRVYLPILVGSTIGFDWGYGFDKTQAGQNKEIKFQMSVGVDMMR